ncbi:transcriptional regulator, AraC family protein [Oceanicola granulosus HTCC2516]|uniref:Transcriptional regulator, AraC family protein n=1 Tax=Oceanicola granulosus (strain ATCC BAA-861 / DSM 15982 / KCTC 12143 / HTCC2516) TaxID=314256 RepID=Q2CBM9_OCEGH|nr:helix-turn-helix domain-containing protein [Oceanicola granulosus]EAR50102.1 transcriptional regulator, AraC family protein [Oceanicola granulosus HTCC2516]
MGERDRSQPQGGDRWQSQVSDAYFQLETDYRDREAFRGSLQRWNMGVIDLSRIECDAVLYRRKRRHFLNETESSLLIAIPETESVQFIQSERRTSCRPGGFLIERSDAPYEYWHAAPNAQWVLKVPTSSVRARVGPSGRLGGLTFDAREGVANYFLTSLRAAAAHVADLDEAGREAAGRHLLDLLCLAIQRDDRVLHSQTSSVRAAHLFRAEQVIRDRLKDRDLTPQAVADACGISLRYLQQLFAETEQSVQGYIRERRLSRCDEDLRQPGRSDSVAEIAYRWGFADQSQFSRHYKARFGRTPRAARKEAARPDA